MSLRHSPGKSVGIPSLLCLCSTLERHWSSQNQSSQAALLTPTVCRLPSPRSLSLPPLPPHTSSPTSLPLFSFASLSLSLNLYRVHLCSSPSLPPSLSPSLSHPQPCPLLRSPHVPPPRVTQSLSPPPSPYHQLTPNLPHACPSLNAESEWVWLIINKVGGVSLCVFVSDVRLSHQLAPPPRTTLTPPTPTSPRPCHP